MVRDEIYETFTDQPEDHTLQHGHTFCGNPIAAAADTRIVDHHCRAMLRAEQRYLAANAATGAGDRHNLAFKHSHRPNLRQRCIRGASHRACDGASG